MDEGVPQVHRAALKMALYALSGEVTMKAKRTELKAPDFDLDQ